MMEMMLMNVVSMSQSLKSLSPIQDTKNGLKNNGNLGVGRDARIGMKMMRLPAVRTIHGTSSKPRTWKSSLTRSWVGFFFDEPTYRHPADCLCRHR